MRARPELAARLSAVAAQDAARGRRCGLEPSDILFVDTSHTVKLGGDVNRVVLELLPLVAPGVRRPLPRRLPARGTTPAATSTNAHYWTEQYLLQAFLMYNDEWEVLVSAQALVRRCS